MSKWGINMIEVTIDYKKCNGVVCSACAFACPTNVFVIKKNNICVTSPQYCKLCNECVKVCPKNSLRVKKVPLSFCMG